MPKRCSFFADLLYQDEVHGDLFTQVNQTIAVLHAKYLKALISYEGIQRVETYPVTEVALREAILNALAHKDYSSGSPIQISVYDDKLMIWNSGTLPPDWTVERLTQKHSSEPFNPDIANAFFRAGMIESWGRGIEKMVAACEAAGLPLPELRYETSGLWVVFGYKPFSSTQPESKSLELRVLEILEARGPMSKSALSTALGQKEVSGSLNKIIRRLLVEQKVSYTIPEKPQSRLQQHRLTDVGSTFLKTLRQKDAT
jgi:ATP-dependent DNA helicase RecG